MFIIFLLLITLTFAEQELESQCSRSDCSVIPCCDGMKCVRDHIRVSKCFNETIESKETLKPKDIDCLKKGISCKPWGGPYECCYGLTCVHKSIINWRCEEMEKDDKVIEPVTQCRTEGQFCYLGTNDCCKGLKCERKGCLIRCVNADETIH